MGETVIEKIIRNNVGKTVKPGDIVTVNVDRVMIHDIFIPFVAEKFPCGRCFCQEIWHEKCSQK